MKTFKILTVSIISLVSLTLIYSFQSKTVQPLTTESNQSINLFVSHGHCVLPFTGKITNLQLDLPQRNDQGNPMEGMNISFNINPNTFNVCSDDKLTNRVKTPGLFISKNQDDITFRSKDVYTMGLDWYQVNGILSIKGVEHKMKFLVTGIRKPEEQMANTLIFEGQVNLEDWDIDYDLIVNGKSNSSRTKWMHLNMQLEI